MSMWRRTTVRLALVAALAACAGLSWWAPVAAAESKESSESPAKALDRLILTSGRVVEGEILEETATEVTIRVVVAGISAPTTFRKSEIMEMTRGAVEAPAQQEKPATRTPRADRRSDARSVTEEPKASDRAAKLFVVELKGRWGVDVSETPLKRVFEEADRAFDDLVPGAGSAASTVVDPAKRDQNIVVLKMDTLSRPGFNTLFRAEELLPIVYNEMTHKGRRVVFWVETAGGGAAFLPWVSPEIYFTNDGRLGGIGNLDEFNVGDNMVKEKLIGAFLGAAEGFAIKGGYVDHLDAIRAMIRQQNWLAVRFEGGRPVYLNRQPTANDGDGWTILSDSGEGEFKDTSAIRGNDIFILEAEWAMKLGIAKGIADTVDDLAFALGVQRDYIELKNNRGQRAATEWNERLEAAIRAVNNSEDTGYPVGHLWREFGEIQVGGDFSERRRNRGRQLNLLRQIRSLVGQYAEVLDPEGGWRAEIDVMIAQLQMQAEQDARAQRQGGRQ